MGALGDRFGRRGALVAGLTIFGSASLASAFATSAKMLIATRALMGIGGALIMPTTLSILTNVFPADERPKAIGIWAAVAGIGVGLGPAAGGFLIEQFDWTAVFLVNVPIVIAALVAIPKLVPDSHDPKQTRLDPVGAVLSTVGLGILTAAIIQAPDWGWTDGRHPRRLRGRGRGARRLRGLGAPHRFPDARRPAVPHPPLHRRERCRHARVLRALRRDLLPDPVPPGGARLHARSRPASGCCRSRPASSSAGRCRRSSPAASGRATWSPSA